MFRCLFLLSVLSVLVIGCATPYQADDGILGGYSSIRVKEDAFIVTFKGNELTPYQDVLKYSMMRASQLTLRNGYQYFAVVEMQDRTKKTHYSNTETAGDQASYHGSFGQEGTSTTYTTVGEVSQPEIMLSVRCFEYDPGNMDVINAGQYLAYNPIKG